MGKAAKASAKRVKALSAKEKLQFQIGQAVRGRRQALGVSQALVGESVCPRIGKGHLSEMETGAKPISLWQLSEFCRVLGMEFNFIGVESAGKELGVLCRCGRVVKIGKTRFLCGNNVAT